MNRLDQQKATHTWERFPMSELRGKTMGIIGCGNVGAHCAGLAKCFGMRVLALRRQPELCEDDDNVDEAFYPDDIGEMRRVCVLSVGGGCSGVACSDWLVGCGWIYWGGGRGRVIVLLCIVSCSCMYICVCPFLSECWDHVLDCVF